MKYRIDPPKGDPVSVDVTCSWCNRKVAPDEHVWRGFDPDTIEEIYCCTDCHPWDGTPQAIEEITTGDRWRVTDDPEPQP